VSAIAEEVILMFDIAFGKFIMLSWENL